jgi:hypothetical protein
MEATMEGMYKIAKTFKENKKQDRPVYISEVVEEMKKLVSDYLYSNSKDDPNRSATVFDSFLFLNESMGIFQAWDKYIGEEFNFEDVYDYCKNKSLVPYLEALQAKDYTGAVEINREHEIAHYHLLLNYLMNIGSSLENVSKLTEEQSKDIYLHCSYMGEVYDLTQGLTYCKYLESAFAYNCETVSFQDVLSILKRENQLREKNAMLEKLNQALQEAIDSKNEMIDRHAHNWKHISYPAAVKEVAEKLAEDDKYKAYANKLFKAYNSENILRQEVLMLKLKHSGSSEEIQKQIMTDVLLSNSRTGVNIEKIIEDSLDLVMFRILMEDVDTSINTEKAKTNLSKFKDLRSLRESYNRSFIIKKQGDISLIDWFRQNIFNIEIHIDDNWKAVKVRKDSAAYAQLVEIWIDLFHNAINYGKKEDTGFIKIELKSDQVEGKDYKSYLKDIVSDKYLNLEADDLQRKAGFLIFLKLMIDLKFPKERIVFLTGNVDLSKIMEIDNLISFYSYYLYDKKIKTYEEFMEAIDKVDEDYDYYESCKVDLKRQYPELYRKLEDLIETDNDIKVCINLLRGEKTSFLANKISTEDPIKASGNTYNRMEPVFLEAGFNPPRAFEKPTESIYDKFNWDFLEWKKTVEHPYYELKLLQLNNNNLSYEQLVDKFIIRKNRKDEDYREIEFDLKRSFDFLSREDPKNYLFSYDVYTKIKNIGDEDSKVQCRMEHIYKLFWHFMFNSYLDYYNGKYTNPNLKFCLDEELCVRDKEELLTYLYMYSWS